MANRFSKLPTDEAQRPLITLYEGWQDSVIDTSIWTVTPPAGGTTWASNTKYQGMICNKVILTANDIPYLSSVHRWQGTSNDTGAANSGRTNIIHKKLVLEFMLAFSAVSNIENVLSFLGFMDLANGFPGNLDDCVGWRFGADNLRGYIGDQGQAGFNLTPTLALTLTNWNKLRIEMSNDRVDWFANESKVFTYANDEGVGGQNYPSIGNFILQFNMVAEAGGGYSFYLGPVRLWYEDFLS